MNSHFLNKFRKETEYHDMYLSFQNVCNPKIKMYENFSEESVENFAKEQPANIKTVLEKLIAIHKKQKEEYKNYIESTQNIPADLEVFLSQIQELKTLMNNAQCAQDNARKALIKEKKAKSNVMELKTKNKTPDQISKAEAEYNKAKEELNILQQKANSQRKLYIEKSDNYTVHFPCDLSETILKLVNQRQVYLHSCSSIADQIIDASNEFKHQEESLLQNIDEIDLTNDDFENFLYV